MSRRPATAGNHLEMGFMGGYSNQQAIPDCYHDPKKWWEVMDCTIGQAAPASQWGLTGASTSEGFCSGSELKGMFRGAGDTADVGSATDVGNTVETKKAETISVPVRAVLKHALPFHEYTIPLLVYAV